MPGQTRDPAQWHSSLLLAACRLLTGQEICDPGPRPPKPNNKRPHHLQHLGTRQAWDPSRNDTGWRSLVPTWQWPRGAMDAAGPLNPAGHHPSRQHAGHHPSRQHAGQTWLVPPDPPGSTSRSPAAAAAAGGEAAAAPEERIRLEPKEEPRDEPWEEPREERASKRPKPCAPDQVPRCRVTRIRGGHDGSGGSSQNAKAMGVEGEVDEGAVAAAAAAGVCVAPQAGHEQHGRERQPCPPGPHAALIISPRSHALIMSPCSHALIMSPCSHTLIMSPCGHTLIMSPCGRALIMSPYGHTLCTNVQAHRGQVMSGVGDRVAEEPGAWPAGTQPGGCLPTPPHRAHCPPLPQAAIHTLKVLRPYHLMNWCGGGGVYHKGGVVCHRGGVVCQRGGVCTTVVTHRVAIVTRGVAVVTRGGRSRTRGGHSRTRGGRSHTRGGRSHTRGGRSHTTLLLPTCSPPLLPCRLHYRPACYCPLPACYCLPAAHPPAPACRSCPQPLMGRHGRATRMIESLNHSHSLPISTLFGHLGRMPTFPWHLVLRVEVDGVLEPRCHDLVLGPRQNHVQCIPAFRPLVGKQFVAWRFMQPATLVFAVKTPGGAPRGRGAAAGSSRAAPRGSGAAAGSSGAAPRGSGTAAGSSGAAAGSSGAAPRGSGAAAGSSWAAPRGSGAAAGSSGAAPYGSGAAAGSSGAAPRGSGAAAGTSGAAAGETEEAAEEGEDGGVGGGAAPVTTNRAATAATAATTRGTNRTAAAAATAATAMDSKPEVGLCAPPALGLLSPSLDSQACRQEQVGCRGGCVCVSVCLSVSLSA